MRDQRTTDGADRSQPATKDGFKRSRRGCPECKKRKIKCDEQRPACGKCQRSGRTCHISNLVFKPHALTSEAGQRQVGTLSSYHTAEAASLPSSPAQDVGRSVDEAAVESESDPVPIQSYASCSQQDSFRSASNFNTSATTRVPHTSPSHLHRSSRTQPNTSSTISLSRETDVATSSLDSLEESFFVRHFSEHIAPWLDLVNFQRYFGHECIVLTRESPLLRFAMCALSAKQLGCSLLSGSKSPSSPTYFRVAQILLRHNSSFSWYGAKYYDKAIKTLAQQITSGDHLSHISPTSPSLSTLSQGEMMTRAVGEDPIVRLLATCLLIQYENLSGNTKGWTGHLDGFSKLLAFFNESLLSADPWSQQVLDSRNQRALRAAYWWYVLNDMENSFIARRPVRVDLDNILLWKHMGLHVHNNGEIINLDISSTPDAPPHLQGDLLSFALIRLVSKLIDALAVDTGTHRSGTLHPAPRLVSNDDVPEFERLQRDIDNWHLSTTQAFVPDYVWKSDQVQLDSPDKLFSTQTWYSHALRAVSMLYYHMAKILLLVNQPLSLLKSQETSFGQAFDLLKMLRSIEEQTQHHTQQIISITQGMLDDGAVRVRAIQPLYVAGRSISRREDRRQLVTMIRSIQDDFGIACEYRIEHLTQEWGDTLDDLGVSRLTNDRRESIY